MSTAPITLTSLHLYPVKSCAGVAVHEAQLCDTGLDLDRLWMVVDAQGEFVSQREAPRLALVAPSVRHGEVILRAPGMLALHLPLDMAGEPLPVRVWDDAVPAYDMGPVAAQWFADYLGQPGLQLARFDPDHVRLASPRWTQGVQARTAFSDGFPLLVGSQATLDDLNARLATQGHAPVDWRRFRPNLVIDGLAACDEDYVDTLQFGDVVLRLVKPCPRCPIPNIDPDTALSSTAVSDTLAGYRSDARVDGAVTFGMNAIVVQAGAGVLQAGASGQAQWAFKS